jgi:hypothetical protein
MEGMGAVGYRGWMGLGAGLEVGLPAWEMNEGVPNLAPRPCCLDERVVCSLSVPCFVALLRVRMHMGRCFVWGFRPSQYLVEGRELHMNPAAVMETPSSAPATSSTPATAAAPAAATSTCVHAVKLVLDWRMSLGALKALLLEKLGPVDPEVCQPRCPISPFPPYPPTPHPRSHPHPRPLPAARCPPPLLLALSGFLSLCCPCSLASVFF